MGGWNVLDSFTANLPTLANLAQQPTIDRYATGQPIVVASGPNNQPASYVLLTNIGTADGVYIVSTPDDSGRQWVFSGILDAGITIITPVMDFTLAKVTPAAPAISGKVFIVTRYGVLTTVATGALSTAATLRIGNSTSPANTLAATAAILVAGTFNEGVLGFTNQNIVSSPAGTNLVQGDTTQAEITIGATGTGGFAWMGKIIMFGAYV